MGVTGESGVPLRDAQVRTAGHTDLAVAPTLTGDPIEGVVAVGRFLFQGVEFALGFVAAADVFDHDGETMIDQGLVIGDEGFALAVGRAHEDGWNAGMFGRQKNIGVETHAVAHGNGGVQILEDELLRRGGDRRG